jgi:hypothetical protein
MSNSFKSNSRFASLVEDIPPLKNEKEQKRDKEEKIDNSTNSFVKQNDQERKFSPFRPLDESEKERRRLKRETEIREQKEFQEKEKDRIKRESLTINTNNFPELVADFKEDNIINDSKSYIAKLTQQNSVIDKIDQDLVDLKPGWVLLKKNSLTGKTVVKKHPEKNVIKEEEVKYSETNVEEEQKYDEKDIFDSLIELHEKRRQEYIDNYGYEEWERKFKFPNWLEEEAYLERMEQELNSYTESECESTDEEEYEYEYK